MEEVEAGKYEATWTAPNFVLEGAVIEVELTDTNGNKVDRKKQTVKSPSYQKKTKSKNQLA